MNKVVNSQEQEEDSGSDPAAAGAPAWGPLQPLRVIDLLIAYWSNTLMTAAQVHNLGPQSSGCVTYQQGRGTAVLSFYWDSSTSAFLSD